jgi:hypothetical protein
LPDGFIRLVREEVIDPPAILLGSHEPGLPQDRQVLGNGRRRQLQQFGNLADAKVSTHQDKDGSDAALIRQGVGNGKDFAHRFTSISYFAR